MGCFSRVTGAQCGKAARRAFVREGRATTFSASERMRCLADGSSEHCSGAMRSASRRTGGQREMVVS